MPEHVTPQMAFLIVNCGSVTGAEHLLTCHYIKRAAVLFSSADPGMVMSLHIGGRLRAHGSAVADERDFCLPRSFGAVRTVNMCLT